MAWSIHRFARSRQFAFSIGSTLGKDLNNNNITKKLMYEKKINSSTYLNVSMASKYGSVGLCG